MARSTAVAKDGGMSVGKSDVSNVSGVSKNLWRSVAALVYAWDWEMEAAVAKTGAGGDM